MKQGYNSRMDERLGMMDGKESSKTQSYKSRRDESRGMKDSYVKATNEKYMPKGMSKKVMGHDKSPKNIKHIKPYSVKPHSQVGLICGEVDNSKGKIKWEFNMPQSPFDFDALPGLKSLARQEVVTETTTIAGAYITQ